MPHNKQEFKYVVNCLDSGGKTYTKTFYGNNYRFEEGDLHFFMGQYMNKGSVSNSTWTSVDVFSDDREEIEDVSDN